MAAKEPFLLAMTKCGDKDVEDPRNFPDAQRVLTVIRTGSGTRQTWEMVEAAIKAGNKWWYRLKSVIRLFVAEYSRRLNLDNLAAETAQEARLERAIKSGDSGEIAVARAELASLQHHL